jgi:hypothetical protein
MTEIDITKLIESPAVIGSFDDASDAKCESSIKKGGRRITVNRDAPGKKFARTITENSVICEVS